MAELMQGELLPEAVPAEEVKAMAESGLAMTRGLLRRRKYMNMLLGGLLSLALLIAGLVHLHSPIYIEGAAGAVTVDRLAGGRLVAVLSDSATGYDMGSVTDPDTGDVYTFISCHRTLWARLTNRPGGAVVALPEQAESGPVFYYPSSDPYSDELIYGESISGGIMTLPRLVYNYWLVLGAAATCALAAAAFFLRRRSLGKYARHGALLALSFTLSIPLCLAGHFGEVYNAPFYLSGILLLTPVIYAALRLASAVMVKGRSE